MGELPEDVVETAADLTRRARRARADDEAAAHRHRRDAMLADHDFVARVREEDVRDVLVFYPAEWLEEGTFRPDRPTDLDRAVEVQLSGPADPEDWDAVDARNRPVARAVRERHGDVHGDTADALADFMGNHYGKPIADATAEELSVFVEDYFPRNAWPSDEQRAVVESSVERAVAVAASLEEKAGDDETTCDEQAGDDGAARDEAADDEAARDESAGDDGAPRDEAVDDEAAREETDDEATGDEPDDDSGEADG